MSPAHDDRIVRLGVLRDRAQRGTTQDSDLLESLDIADAAVQDANAAGRRATERQGWQDLIKENTTHLANAIVVMQKAEPHLAHLAEKAKSAAAFYRTLQDKKVILSIAFLIFLIVGGLAGFLSFQAVNVADLIPGNTAPSAVLPLPTKGP